MRKSFSIFERLVRKYTGLRVEAEYRFHPARDWAFDFAIPAACITAAATYAPTVSCGIC